MQLVGATNYLAGSQFVLHGLQKPLNVWQMGDLIHKHGGSCISLTQVRIPAITYAIVAVDASQPLLDELAMAQPPLQSLTQPRILSQIKEAWENQQQALQQQALQQQALQQQALQQVLPQQVNQQQVNQQQVNQQQVQMYAVQQPQNLPAQVQVVEPPPRPQSPVPPVPYWILEEVAKLRIQFPEDRFDCMMERSFYPNQYPRYGLGLYNRPPSPTDGFVAKMFCLDCPDQRAYQVGIGKLANFRMHHLEKPLHRERVEARKLDEAPMDQAARLQQVIASRQW